jgi:hypothetical protein
MNFCRWRLLLLVAMAGFVISSGAQSPLPPPTATAKEKDVSGVENRQVPDANSPTQTPTVTVNQTTPKSTEKSTGAESARRLNVPSINWSRINVGLLTLFNGLLALVGFLQWRSTKKQAGYMRDGLAETKRAADAARLSADAATEAVANSHITERAIVLIENVEATMGIPAHGLEVASVVIFTLKNFGRTIPYSVELDGALTGIGNLPIEKLPPTTIAPQGTNSWATKSISHLAISDIIQKINQGTGRLEYKIVVTYRDTFGAYTYHCEGRYEPALKRFLTTASKTD